MELYLRKGGTAENYVPFSDEEFERAKAFLDKDLRFEKKRGGDYRFGQGHIQFSDAPDKLTRKMVHRQVNITTDILTKDHVVKKLIEILKPAFVLDIDSKRYELSEFLLD